MKKYISIIAVIIILINALSSSIVYGKELQPYTDTDLSGVQTPEDIGKFLEHGTASGSSDEHREIDGNTVQISKTHDRDTSLKPDQGSYVASALAGLIGGFGRIINSLMTLAVDGDVTDITKTFTIENLVFGKYELFDINIFNKAPKATYTSDTSKQIKESVAEWYGTLRMIAIVASVCTLIYIGIRMAISTVTSDKAKYKKMFEAWIVSIVLIFGLHYVIIILLYLSDLLVQLFASAATENGFEVYLLQTIFKAGLVGWEAFLAAILYCMMVYYQLKFFVMYTKRVISNAFLILIAPLVTITYSMDKAGDNSAKAFKNWRTELITNIFIQPMHALMFLVFLYTALEIAKIYPIIAILFIFGLSTTERLLRALFKLGGSSIASVDDSLKLNGLWKKD